jgi:putative addiction module component (TIGR02574 family)
MPATVESLGIDRLTVDEQLALVHAIWDRIAAAGTGSLLTDAQRQELRRRAAEDDANPDDLVPWERVKAESQLRRKA